MSKIIFSDKVYNILKYIVIVFLPALTTFYGVVGTVIVIPYTDVVLIILTGLDTFLGSLIGISTKNYNGGSENGTDFE